MASSQVFIVRITRDPRRFAASARRIDEEVCGEFAQPQQLLNFLLGRAADGHPRTPRSPDDNAIAPDCGREQPTR
ncbi:MAG TPA: hypothetical protein VFO28_13705 [Burkholderiaceae bacterium]|nr:hypothetical protein [Burkholderiaceae bacterium]